MKNYLPVVKIGRIVLREICEYDYLDYFEIGRDLETVKYLNWGPFIKPNDALWVINEIFLKRPLDGIPKGYAIILDNRMIGVIDFHTYFPEQNACEVGYVLHRDYWNLGIMKKCLKKVTEIGFRHLCLDKIIVGHGSYNLASRNVILACGYKYEFQKLVNIKGIDDIAYYYAYYKYEFEGGI